MGSAVSVYEQQSAAIYIQCVTMYLVWIRQNEFWNAVLWCWLIIWVCCVQYTVL